MRPGLQAKMLRLLQEQAFERVGGNETLRTDVRLIAATHRDLKVWSDEGRFRPDLYYRLGVFANPPPPLRERGGALLIPVRRSFRPLTPQPRREVPGVPPGPPRRLLAPPPPRNVRERASVPT